jgi:hypothetical protein
MILFNLMHLEYKLDFEKTLTQAKVNSTEYDEARRRGQKIREMRPE